jgi:hypothetical protein
MRTVFNILVCEDNPQHIIDIKIYFSQLQKKFPSIDFKHKIKDFKSVVDALDKEFDLLVLDFFDGETMYGDKICIYNREKRAISTVIYTQKGEDYQVDYQRLKDKFPFLEKYLSKGRDGENLIDFISDFLFLKGLVPKKYELYNENDTILKHLISALGESQFSQIIDQIVEREEANDKVIVAKMTSGLSGAVVFKIKIASQFYILKLSKEVQKLKEEHENSKKLYHKFISRFTNHIYFEELTSKDNLLFGILIKEVTQAQTLFDFVQNLKTTDAKIASFLDDLFLSSQSMKTNYDNQTGIGDWTTIFTKIDSFKFSRIMLAYKELDILINAYSDKIDFTNMQNLVEHKKYGNLNVNSMLGEEYKKPLVLCHGDFHSKNILVQSDYLPVLIDTGGLGYQYWCIDICRLIVNLFLLGIDFGSIRYYDIARIDDNLAKGRKLISCEPIDDDSLNHNVITTINWLVQNTPSIYGILYSKFEFQLGLMKEFLQATTWAETLPAEKRALSAILAFNAMIEADKNVNG